MVEVADLAGQTIGRITVIEAADCDHFGHPQWQCRCICGTEFVRRQWVLVRRKGHLSCGCRKVEYAAWYGAIQRCTNRYSLNYRDYGGRGIKVCDEWLASFDAFYDHIGPRPSDEHSLDRIENDGHYEPGNVRWTTSDVQRANQRPHVPRGTHYPLLSSMRKMFPLQPDLSDFPAQRAFA